MKKILLFLALAAMSVSCAKGPGRIADHVIFIGLDGWGAYSVEKADMPHVKQLMADGSYTLKKRSVLPSSSSANWSSMYMGASPELHGYTTWGSRTPDLPSRVLDEDGIFPTVFGLLHRADPGAEIGCIYQWEVIRDLVDSLALTYDKWVNEEPLNPNTTKAAVDYILEKKPTFLHVVYNEPDEIGHSAGHDTPEYYAVLHELDGYVGEIVQAVKDAGIYDDTIFILTADHGGINKGHGGKTMLEMETPFIIAGKNVRKGLVFEESMMQFDIAPTIAHIFGLEVPQVWIGRPMLQVFE